MGQQGDDRAAVTAAGPAATAAGPAATAPGTRAGGSHRAGPGTRAGREAGQLGGGQAPGPGPGRIWRRPWLRETLVALAFVAAGVIVTWPRPAYLGGQLPSSNDSGQYVWDLWWVAHQVAHLGNPWFSGYQAAPVGVRLGFETLMPLPGLVMTPVTLLFGPSAAFNLLAIVMPGLAGYAMYRLARLWLPGQAGPLAAGAFYGLSGMFAFQDWYHINLAAGAVFLPLAMEAAIRLRRGATIRRGVILGLVLGAAMLVDQEFAVLALILAALLLVPWLWRRHGRAELAAVGAGALTALVVASPQLAAMAQQAAAGGTGAPGAMNYISYAAELPALFAPSPRLAGYGLGGLASAYQAHTAREALATFGIVLTLLALAGLVVSWRRRSGKLLGLLWLGSALLALGPTLYLGGRQYVPLASQWRGLQVSLLMPYTWLIRVPGLSSFREADRLAFLGLAGAALLAGAAVTWLRQHARLLLIAVVVAAALEAGWPGPSYKYTMPTALPAVDRPVAADHSGSIVVDVPFGVIGTLVGLGPRPSPLAQVLATADGHPRAVAYTGGTVAQTLAGIRGHAFYDGLIAIQRGKPVTPALAAAGRQDLRGLPVGWVLVWQSRWFPKHVRHGRRYRANFPYPVIDRYLRRTGFHLAYQADGVRVYRR